MQLPPYSNIRSQCPECGSKRSFAPFRGYESDFKGKCHSCGVFIPLSENLSIKPTTEQINRHKKPIPPTKYIAQINVLESQVNLERDIFSSRLINLGISKEHLINWFIGRGKNLKTLFFYKNMLGKFNNAKEILYNSDLHRNKNTPPKYLFSREQGYSQCLFGEWQLNDKNFNKAVLLVESEKTAIIASYVMPDKIWIASGGANSLTKEKAYVLKNRQVFIIVDSDKAGRDAAIKSKHLLKSQCKKVTIMDLFPKEKNGIDLADYFIVQLQNLKKNILKLSKSEYEIFEERAAIIEYEGKESKYESELLALKRINKQNEYQKIRSHYYRN